MGLTRGNDLGALDAQGLDGLFQLDAGDRQDAMSQLVCSEQHGFTRNGNRA